LEINDLTYKINGAIYEVNRILGSGFLEKVYENSMRIELVKMGLTVEQQKNLKVYYESEQVGYYYADLMINDILIV